MTHPTRSTIRYAAQRAYQLFLMRNIQSCTIAKLHCVVYAQQGYVVVQNIGPELAATRVPIAKSWANL